MYKVFLFPIFFFFINNNYSQSYIWGTSIGGHIDDYAIDIDKTSNGIIVTSSVDDPWDNRGLYYYDLYGNLVWELDILFTVSSPSLIYGNLIGGTVVDENDNIYTLVHSRDNNEVLINGVSVAPGVSLLKININGDLIWSKKIGGRPGNTNIEYKDGFIYVVGDFGETINVNDEVSLTSKYYYNCFSNVYNLGLDYYIVKFSTSGDLINALSFGDEYDDYVSSIVIDEFLNLYVIVAKGFYACTTTKVYIKKFNSNLELQWSKEVCSNENGSEILYPENSFLLEGSLYLFGHNQNEVTNDDFTIPESSNINKASLNVLEYSINDGSFIKFKQFSNVTTNKVWLTQGIDGNMKINKCGVIDYNDDLIILSSLYGTMQFDDGEILESTYYDSDNGGNPIRMYDENLFLMKINKANFNTDLITVFTPNNHNEAPTSVDNPSKMIIAENNIFLTASFRSNPINVLNNSIINNSGNNDNDVLVLSLNIDNLLSTDNKKISSVLNIYPNPTNNHFYYNSTNLINSIKIYSVLGNLISTYYPNNQSGQINLNSLKQGTYFLHFSLENNSTKIEKLIIIGSN